MLWMDVTALRISIELCGVAAFQGYLIVGAGWRSHPSQPTLKGYGSGAEGPEMSIPKPAGRIRGPRPTNHRPNRREVGIIVASRANRMYVGVPGGCGIPRMYEQATNSPQSQNDIVGDWVRT